MKRAEAIQLCLDYLDITDPDEALRRILVSDECHNVAVCPVCEECFDVEPDAQPFFCHNNCIVPDTDRRSKVYPLTLLLGVGI